MTDLARLAIEIESQQAVKAKRDLDNLTAAGGRTEQSLSGAATASRLFGAALAGVALLTAARQVIQVADAYAMLTARLSLVTRGTSPPQYDGRSRSSHASARRSTIRSLRQRRVTSP